jgi:hypothetical protein
MNHHNNQVQTDPQDPSLWEESINNGWSDKAIVRRLSHDEGEGRWVAWFVGFVISMATGILMTLAFLIALLPVRQ